MVASCTRTESIRTLEGLVERDGTARILLMPPDIVLGELTAAGLLEPKAEWTETAKAHVTAALIEFLDERDAKLITYPPPAGDAALVHDYTQLMKLHDAVITAMIRHKFVPLEKLPTKEEEPLWTLGEGVRVLTRDRRTEYGLFVKLQDSYSSPERVPLNVIIFLLAGGVAGGVQQGFASLIDLNSGE